MQIKPHQIPHFARQMERFKLIIQRLHHVVTFGYVTNRGSYFSKRWEKPIKVDFNFSYDTIDIHGDVHEKGCFSKSLEEHVLFHGLPNEDNSNPMWDPINSNPLTLDQIRNL